MESSQVISNLEIFTSFKSGLDALKDFFLSSGFKGNLTSSLSSDDEGSFFQDLKKSGSNFDMSREMSSKDLSGIWEGFSLYALPKSWKWMRLDQVGTIVGGGTPDTSNGAYWAKDSGTPWITPADMRQQGMYVFGGKRNLTEIGIKESSSKLLPANSIVFSSRAPIGYVGISGVPLATNQGFKSCVPFMPEMAKFIYFYLKFIGAEMNKRATGTTFKEVSGKQFAATPIPVPPMTTQRAIVDKIEEFFSISALVAEKIIERENIGSAARKSAVDSISTARTEEEFFTAWNRIQQNWNIIAGTPDGIDSLRGLILDLAVTGRLVSRKTTPKQSAIRRSELSETSWGKFAPPDWSLTTLADSCLKISDGTHKTPNYRETGVPFLSIKDISGGKIDFSRTRYISQAEHDELCKRIKPSRGDVLFCRIGTLGRAITIETDQEFSIFVSLGLLRPKPVLNPKYLEIALNSPISHKQFDSIKAGGSHTQKLNLVAMSKYIVWYPDLDTQSEIVNRVTSLMQLCDRIESELKKREVITKNFAQSVLSV